MNRQKRKRLKKKGWQIGAAKDFLGLTFRESVYIKIKLMLKKWFKKL